MGGNAFPGRCATRLTSPQLLQLYQYAPARLAPLFRHGISTGRYTVDKVTHGDLDIIAAWDDELAAPNKLKGAESGALDARDARDAGGVADEKKREIRAMCGAMCEELGATEWKRNGPEVSFVVPVGVIGVELPDSGGDIPFYQLDVLLVPPSALQFASMSMSYSDACLMLATVVRCISRSLTLHIPGLILRHSPFFGLKGIDVELTSEPGAFCSWLGLDYERFRGPTFETEREFWQWLVDVEDGCLWAIGLRKLAKRRGRAPTVPSSKGQRKNNVDRFIDFLNESTHWAGVAMGPTAPTINTVPLPSTTPQRSPTTQQSITPPNQLIPPVPTLSPTSTTSTLSTETNYSILDAEAPVPLSPRAIEALEFWGKLDEYHLALEERRVKAQEISENQQKRMGSKRLHELRSLHTALEEQGLSTITKGGPGAIGEGGKLAAEMNRVLGVGEQQAADVDQV